MEILWLAIGLILGAALGIVLGLYAVRGRSVAAESRAAVAEARLDELRNNSAFTEQSAQRQQLAQSQLLRELQPMRSELTTMRETVAELEQERIELHGRLSEQLRLQATSDRELREATHQLASAMRANTTRGNWGEAQLRNLLESAGMIHHVDFDTQVTVSTDDGKQRPDAIVHLPGDHHLIIDAKAPMSYFLDAMRLRDHDDESARRRTDLMRKHAGAVRGHVDALRARDYPAAVSGSARFVIAYIPSEAAVSAALNHDAELLDYAFARGVAIASPVTLWSILRSVAAAWQQERVSESAAEVLQLSQELYHRFATTSEHLSTLGKRLRGSVDAYDKLVGSVETRLFPTARKLAEFDPSAKSLETLKPVERTPRSLTAPEFDHAAGAET
ncbi:DNA recombination protein RmuC [Gulosibacter bifidus]|uniref:DNA recombination protein RmuC n=1 Tax=Gulosibacter bifidus TaxID=272239 RepID=A0ABW5RGS1_9MICO|nr:DNA recombination protein RmuC [Gulosibacter bifidus]